VRTVAIVNQKGGCGKTTTAISLAGVYASQGLRVLLVDMDPQSHCAAGLGIPEKRIELDITDALTASPGAPLDPTRLIWKPSRNLDLIPSRMRLAGLEAQRGGLADREDRHTRLAKVLARVADQYDLCLIDCSPAVGLLTYNALAAATTALIPVETSFFALQGASRQVSTVRSMAKHLNVPLRTWLVATLHDPQTPLAVDLFDELRRRFGDAVCPYTVRHDVRLREAASIGKTIVQHAPDSLGADDYAMVAGWLRSKLGARPSDLADPLANIDVAASPLPGLGSHELSELQDVGLTAATAEGAPRGVVQVITGAADSISFGHRVAAHAAAVTPHIPVAPVAPVSPMVAAPIAPAISIASASSPGPAALSSTGSASTPSPAPISTPAIPTVGIAEQIAADLRARAATRSEEMARLAQKLSSRGTASSTPETPAAPEPAAPSLTLLPELKPVSGATPVNLAMGYRETSQGTLFVLPLALGNSVAIAGDFNGWSCDRHRMKANHELAVFELCIPLPPGRYSYRLVIDGRWQNDPFNNATATNPYGEPNSVLEVISGPRLAPAASQRTVSGSRGG
jgi:chromosome partitioning protein